jgi:hypothetical protein
MFTRTIPLFEPTAAPTTAAALYTVPNAVRTRIAKVTAANGSTDTVRELTAYLVPSGDTAAAANAILTDFAIGPLQTVTLADLIGHVLSEGDSIQIIVDTGTDVILFATGTEVTV